MSGRVIIWGTGEYYELYKKEFEGFEVIAIVDNDSKKQGMMLDGVEVVSPNVIKTLKFDKVYIICTAINAVKKQLLNLGVQADKIQYFFDLKQKTGEVVFQKEESYEGKKRVAMVAHDFLITGASNCQFQMATYLVKEGYDVRVGAPTDGEMKILYQKIGAESFVDERLRMGTLADIEWANDCDILMVNTVQMYYLLRVRNTSIPLIWWLHEPSIFYRSVVPEIINSLPVENMNVYTVSKVADEAFHEICKIVKTEQLLFGVEDCGKVVKKTVREGVRFIIIGQVSKVKGHDVLVAAIRLLTDAERKQCEFVIVGDNSSDFAKGILNELGQTGVKYISTGTISHEEAMHALSVSDVLICASRTETVSMAVVEAMMFEVPVIVSDKAGVVEYVDNGVNGLVFESENVESLCTRVRWVLDNKKETKKIGLEGRKAFINLFDLKKFEKRNRDVFQKINRKCL